MVVAGIEDRNNVYRCGISHKVFRRPMTYGDNDILTRVSCFVKGFCFDVSLLICTHILKEIKPLKTMLTDTCGFYQKVVVLLCT